MVDRSVTVRLRAEVFDYDSKLDSATRKTTGLVAATDALDGSLVRVQGNFGSSGSEIDKLSGRVRILTDLLAIGAPALTSFGAAGVGGMLALSAQAGAAAGALGVTLLAVHGLGDGLKALDAYQLDPTAENLAKLNEVLKKLGPSGAAFVEYLDKIEPQLRSLQMTARNGLLPGVEDDIEAMLSRLPELRSLIRGVSTEVGDLAADSGKAFAGDKLDAFFGYLKNDGVPILDDTARTVGNLALAGLNLMAAFAPLQRDISGGLLDWSRGLERASEGLGDSSNVQKLMAYIETEGPVVVATLGSIATAALDIVTDTAPLGGPVLKILGTFADVLDGIADSDIGTPIFTGVLALSAYNRALAVTKSLQSQAFSGAKTPFGLIGAGVQSDIAAVKQLPAVFREASAAQTELSAAETKYESARATYVSRLQSQNRMVAEGYTFLGNQGSESATRLADSLGQVEMANHGVQAATERVNTAEAERSRVTRASMLELGKTAGVIGGLAAVSSGAADKIGLTNTASLALLGTMAGPWGAAIGGGIGLLLDWRASSQKAAAEAQEFTATLDAQTGALTDNTRQLAIKKLTDADAYDAAQKLGLSLSLVTDAALGNTDAQTHLNNALGIYDAQQKVAFTTGRGASAVGAYTDQASAAELLESAVGHVSTAVGASQKTFDQQSQAMGTATHATNELRSAYIATDNAAKDLSDELQDLDGFLSKRSSFRSYEADLDALRKSLKDSPKDWSAFNDAGRTNLNNLDQTIADAKQHLQDLTDPLDASKNASARVTFLSGVIDQLQQIGKTSPAAAAAVKQVLPELRAVQDANKALLIRADNADAMKKTKETELALRDLALQHPRPAIGADASQALNIFGLIERDLNQLNGKTATTYVRTIHTTQTRPGTSVVEPHAAVSGNASGGLITGPGGPRDDRIPALLSNREYVVQASAVDHYGVGFMDALNTRRFADGGRVGGVWHTGPGAASDGPGVQVWTAGAYSAQKALAAFKHELDDATKTVAKDKKARDDLVQAEQSFMSSVSGAYSKADLFSGTLSDFDTGAQANANDTTAAQTALAAAASNGLNGPLYQALAASGNLALVQQFGGLSAAEIQQRENEYAAQSNAQGSLATSAATTAGFPQLIREQTRQMRQDQQERKQLASAVKQLETTVKHLGKNVEDGARKGVGDKNTRAAASSRTSGGRGRQ
jgi:hypothetical protein